MATSYGQITLSKLEETYSVILSNESHTFSASSSAALSGSVESSVFAYKGDERIAATIGTISGKPTGMTVSISNNGTINAKFTVAVTTSMMTKSGVLTIPITVDGNSFEKKFSYSLALSGTSVTVSSTTYAYQLSTSGTTVPTGTWSSTPVAPTTTQYAWTRTITTFSDGSKATTYTVGGRIGDTGATGKGVSSIVKQYYLSTSNTGQSGGSWSATPAAYVSGRYYWVRDSITWTDGSTTTSEAVLDNGLNSANSKAEEAQSVAASAQTAASTALAQSVEYIAGTQTAVTGAWTGVTTDSALMTGKTIAYKLPYAGSGDATLQLTLAGGTVTAAIPVYLNTTRVTTHFGANAIINMTYDGSAWRASSIPNTNNYDRVLLNNDITAYSAITAGRIICGSNVGYKNIGTTVSFDLGYPLLYAASAISASSTGKNNYLSYPSVDASSNGTIESGAAKKTLYLKGTVSGNTFTIAGSGFMTTVEPTSENGFYYIPLGVMYSATQIYFQSSNKLYTYTYGAFQAVDVLGQRLAVDSINRLTSLEPTVNEYKTRVDTLEGEILSQVSSNYVATDGYEQYKEKTTSTISHLSDKIEYNFTRNTELTNAVDNALSAYKDKINRYIRFDENGIEIGDNTQDNPLSLKLGFVESNKQEIGFYNSGTKLAYWDGDMLDTGNVKVKQFRIGNFVAIPRTNGSVSWMKGSDD